MSRSPEPRCRARTKGKRPPPRSRRPGHRQSDVTITQTGTINRLVVSSVITTTSTSSTNEDTCQDVSAVHNSIATLWLRDVTMADENDVRGARSRRPVRRLVYAGNERVDGRSVAAMRRSTIGQNRDRWCPAGIRGVQAPRSSRSNGSAATRATSRSPAPTRIVT